MTEKLYSLDEIEAAFATTIGAESEGAAAASQYVFEKFARELTRPQPEFRENQVVVAEGPNHFGYYKVGRQPDKVEEGTFLKQSRPLTLEEVGPGYVSVEDVRPLVDAVRDVCGFCQAHQQDTIGGMLVTILDALPDNLKELIDE